MTAGRKSITLKKDWGTPKKYVEAVRLVFDDEILLDPCSNKSSIVNAETEFMLPQHDGLDESWYNYSKIYVNPPYGTDMIRGTRIKDWLKKCAETNNESNAEILVLIPVATNTSHWKQYIFGMAESICFLFDTRLKFLQNGKDEGKGAPMACAMIYYGHDPEKFHKVFQKHGAVVSLNNLKH